MEYAIINSATKQFFSLLNGGLFTDTEELAQKFISDVDAMICTEEYIDSEDGFLKFGAIDTEVIDLPYYPCISDLDANGDINFK